MSEYESAKNSVRADNQVTERERVKIVRQGGKKRVIFLGNSITRAMYRPEIGWTADWGMAASDISKDYVHIVLDALNKKYGKVDYCICSLSFWEKEYFNDELLYSYQEGRDFNADIVIVRVAENVFGARDYIKDYPLAPYWDKMIKFFSPNPNAHIVVTDDFWRTDFIDEPIHQVAKDNGYILVKLGDIGENPENKALGQFWHEGIQIHPNDKGMKAIAERILKEGKLI
ncbi:MAG: SGNH/GDSL hydrolase family protein [Clostridiales bacterium]|nr:SGNH/GDSL hydrolase family protein [Clostridiales bacterium]